MFFSNQKDVDILLNSLDSLENYIKGDINTLDLKDGIKNKNLQKVEEKIVSIANIINKKNISELRVFGEIMLVCEKLSDGFTDDRVALKSVDEKVNYISYTINEVMNNISKSLSNVLTILNQYKQNDYRNSIDSNMFRGGQFKELLEGINDLQKAITNRVLQSYKIGMTMEHQSSILEKEVGKLTQATHQQIDSIKQTAKSIENMTSSIKSNTKTAEQMHLSGKELKSSATKSLNMIEDTKSAMESIDKSTILVNEAISAISQIAFQTNILSLNAAVEAATAGEAGKGFAVVAQEVRNLANRSAQAAQTIQNLMDQLKSQTSKGKTSAINMGEEFTSLNNNINDTLINLEIIVEKSKEQKNDIEHINDSIKNIDQAAIKNSKSTENVNTIAVQSSNVATTLVQSNQDINFEGKEAMETPDELISSLFTKEKIY